MTLGERNDIRRILIIQTAFIGDVVLVTPLIRAAKNAFPQAKVDAMVIPAAADLLQTNPYLERIVVYDKRGREAGLAGLWRMARKMRLEKYDMVLVPHRSLRSAVVARATGAKWRVGLHNSAGAFLLTHKIPYMQSTHEVDRNLSLIEALGISITDRRPEIFSDAEDVARIDSLLEGHRISRADLIAVAPGSVWATKRWPAEYFKSLVSRLVEEGRSVCLIGGEADGDLCQVIAAGLGERVLNLCGQLSLRCSAELIRQCRVLVSNDSAPQHLASAVGTPVVAIFGSTVPAFGFYPYGPNNTVVEHELACRPCGIHGKNRCPIGTLDCMRSILPERVHQAILKYVDVEKPIL